jgi:hypothetical protein
VLNEKRLRSAIEYELSNSPGFVGILNRIGSFLLSETADLIRKLELGVRRWNASLNSYKPIIPIRLLDNMVKGWNSFKKSADRFFSKAQKAATWCGRFIPLIGAFIRKFIITIIDIFNAVFSAIDFIMKIIAKGVKVLKLVNAFICGVLNEVIELIAGIFDILAPLLKLTDPLERATVKETLENIIEDYGREPGKIIEQIKQGYENLLSRYSSDKSEYEIAYNLGEDAATVLLWAGAIIKAVGVFKNLPKRLKAWVEKKKTRIKKAGWLSANVLGFGEDITTMRNLIKLQGRLDDGYINVLTHGTVKKIKINGRLFKVEEFAEKLINNGYKSGTPIRLIACYTGANTNGFAAKLSKIINAEILAPTKRIAVDDMGEFIHETGGKFISFKP